MEDATEASQPSSAPLPPQATVAPPTFSVDLITRSTAPLLLMVYGLGFVILGFHDARYGVVQFSPFRTRIVLVGLVFAALVGLTALAEPTLIPGWDNLESVRADSDPKRRFFRETVLAAGFIFTATLMASLLSAFLFSSVHGQPPWKWWRWLIWLAAYFLLLGGFDYINKIFVSKPRRAALLAVTAYVIFLAAMTAIFPYPTPWVQLAFFFALVRFEIASPRRSGGTLKYLANPLSWPLPLVIIWIYISQIFILLPPRWGGGQPTPIVVYLNNPVAWSPENPTQVLLLDETDQGIYVLLSPSGKAFFVPRSNVASVFFGTKDEAAKKP
jgi:hypothetical protein